MDERFEIHKCADCGMEFEVFGQEVEADEEDVWQVIIFEGRCPSCQSDRWTGVAMKKGEECPACGYAWEVIVNRFNPDQCQEVAVCECCPNQTAGVVFPYTPGRRKP